MSAALHSWHLTAGCPQAQPRQTALHRGCHMDPFTPRAGWLHSKGCHLRVMREWPRAPAHSVEGSHLGHVSSRPSQIVISPA